jgi:hypothetical protein
VFKIGKFVGKIAFGNERLVVFKVVMFAVPRTYRFDPGGGALRVPMETPFWYATFPATVVHWDEVMAIFAAAETRPY